RLADTRLARQHAERAVVDGLLEGPSQTGVARALVEEGLALRVLRQGVMGERETRLVVHGSVLLWVVGHVILGREMRQARRLRVLLDHLRERIEARRLHLGRRLARDASPRAVGVGDPVEPYRVAVEVALAEDLGQRALAPRVEAQLDLLARQLGAHLQPAALPADGSVLAHRARPAVQEDRRKLVARRRRTQ